MSPEDVQHVLDRVRARMPVAPATMEAALEYIGERWQTATDLRQELTETNYDLSARIYEVEELKEEVAELKAELKELKRERPVQSDDEPDSVALGRHACTDKCTPTTHVNPGCLHCGGWTCARCAGGLPF